MIATDLTRQQALDADQKQYSKLVLLEILIKKQQCVSLLKKENEPF